MYVKRLSSAQFRCFEEVDVEFQYPGRSGTPEFPTPSLVNVNLLLGDNGSGKSAMLKCLALAILSPIIQSSGFRAYLLVRRVGLYSNPQDPPLGVDASVAAHVVIHDQDAYPVPPIWQGSEIGLDIGGVGINRRLSHESFLGPFSQDEEKWRATFEDEAPGFFMVGYGATRRVENPLDFDPGARNKARSPRYQRVASLFEDYVGLVPISAWMQSLRTADRQEEGTALLNQMLSKDIQLWPDADGEILFRSHQSLLPFDALSDGYRAFIGWVVDLMYHMCQVTPPAQPLTSLTGVVMVDEIDLHLHPEWQRTVVNSVATTFPNLQFIFTSHSPIVAGTLEAANILVTETDESGAATVKRFKEHIYGLSADQILTGSYFGLATSRAPGAVDQLTELATKAWAGDKNASLEYLRRLTDGFDAPSDRTDESDHADDAASAVTETSPA